MLLTWKIKSLIIGSAIIELEARSAISTYPLRTYQFTDNFDIITSKINDTKPDLIDFRRKKDRFPQLFEGKKELCKIAMGEEVPK